MNREHLAVEDRSIEALISLERTWNEAHRGFVWSLDRWGEGPSAVTLERLGISSLPCRFVVLGFCLRHLRREADLE